MKQDNRLATLDPLNEAETKPYWLKLFTTYFTLGLLWIVSFFGFIIVPILLRAGSRHSYLGEKIDEGAWTFFYVILFLYTILSSIYLTIYGYHTRFLLISIINIILLICFFAAVIISAYTLFS